MGTRLGLAAAIAGGLVLIAAGALTVTDTRVDRLLAEGNSSAFGTGGGAVAAPASTDSPARSAAAVSTISRGQAVDLTAHAGDARRVLFEFTADW